MELYHYGDRELWYAKAQDDSWSLPFIIEWKVDLKEEKHYGLVMPAVCLYNSQLLLVKALLDHHDIQKSPNRWLVPKAMVEVLLHKAQGITPTYHYKWTEDNYPPLPTVWKNMQLKTGQPDNIRPESDRSFISFVAQEHRIPSSVVAMVLKAVSSSAPKWLLEERKVIDLGFATLMALPYRANWKEIVAFKFRKWKLLGMLGLPQQNKEDALIEAGVPEGLCSPQNLGIRRATRYSGGYYIDYTLETVPKKKFNEAIRECEGKRLACGTTSYVLSFERTVETLYPHILDALENYLHKTSLPFARLHEGIKRRLLNFLPTRRNQVKVRGVVVNKLPVHIVTPDSCFSAEAESSDEVRVREKAPPLQALPAVSSAVDDVRGCEKQGDVEQPGEGGTDGLPMLHASQGHD